ncbi:MAG: hypothetical protein K6C36_00525 [Clostridia bacterium]|nr:hypothetical protein [Clostridia bacterium]
MEFEKKIAYIKGLIDGIGLDESKPESRVISAIVDALECAAEELKDVNDHVDMVDSDLAELEDWADDADESIDALFDEYADGEYDGYDDFDDGDEELYECYCPNCRNYICFDYDDVEDDLSLTCPYCGKKIENPFEDDGSGDDADEDDED